MLDGAIDRVALADAAEVDAHPFSFQKRRARALVHVDVAIVDERQTRQHLAAIGDGVVLVLVVELPQSRQRAKGDVESSACPLADLTRHAEHFANLGADRDRMLARRRVQPRDIAAVAPDAHQRIEPIEFREDRLECRRRSGFVRRPRRRPSPPSPSSCACDRRDAVAPRARCGDRTRACPAEQVPGEATSRSVC